MSSCGCGTPTKNVFKPSTWFDTCGGASGYPDWGTCHICQKTADINYCDKCEHWFCVPCSTRWVARSISAVSQFLFGKKKGCCGPR